MMASESLLTLLKRVNRIFTKDLTTDELSLIRTVRLVQFYTAGVDFILLQALPAECPIATNGGVPLKSKELENHHPVLRQFR